MIKDNKNIRQMRKIMNMINKVFNIEFYQKYNE